MSASTAQPPTPPNAIAGPSASSSRLSGSPPIAIPQSRSSAAQSQQRSDDTTFSAEAATPPSSFSSTRRFFALNSGGPSSSPTNDLATALRASAVPLSLLGIARANQGTDGTGLDSFLGQPSPVGSHYTYAPASSILLNPICKRGSPAPIAAPDKETSDPSTLPDETPGASSSSPFASPPAAPRPAPVVTHIPAAPLDLAAERRRERQERREAREREERERIEKEKEREAKEREARLALEIQEKEERLWGIPKKAFLMGLGSVPGAINFNAQMAMMAGWGNGSGGPTDFSLNDSPRSKGKEKDKNRRPSTSRADGSGNSVNGHKSKSSAASNKPSLRKSLDNESVNSSTRKSQDSNRTPASRDTKEEQESSEEEGERLDPEELAALNAIINTRRSMAAAQALASGEVKLPAPKRPIRPLRKSSNETLPTLSSAIGSPTSPTGERPPLDHRESANGSETLHSHEEGCPTSPSTTAKIRFAPLPRTLPSGVGNVAFDSMVEGSESPRLRPTEDDIASGSASFSTGVGQNKVLSRSQDSLDAGACVDDASDSDVDEDDAGRGSRKRSNHRNRWYAYLVGLPPPASARGDGSRSRKRTKQDGTGVSTPRAGSVSGDDAEDDSPSRSVEQAKRGTMTRRLSTGTLGLMSSAERARRQSGDVSSPSSTPSGSGASKSSIGRGRPRSRLGRNNSVKGSSTARSPSAGSAVDEEDAYQRRRQLILAARPGGTGMVTLPDGTKVKARRVGDAEEDEENLLGYEDWGFAGLMRGKKLEDEESPEHEEAAAGGPADALSGEISHAVPPQEDAGPQAAADRAVASSTDETTVVTSAGAGKRAEDIRRRHEAEMAALGAEVLAAHRRKIGAAKEAAAAAAAAAATGGSSNSKESAGTASASAAPANTSSAESTETATALRPRSTNVELTPTETAESRSTKTSEPGRSKIRRPSFLRRKDSGKHRRQDSGSPGASLSDSSKTSVPSSLYLTRSTSETRLAIHQSPMSHLPRKPDAKGYAVVPLPSDIGVRPERPREGRILEWSDESDMEAPDEGDDDNESSPDFSAESDLEVLAAAAARGASESAGAPAVETAARVSAGAGEDEDDDQADDLDEAEKAEEERRKEAQYRRATTSAAGLERMRVRGRNESSGALPPPIAPLTDVAGAAGGSSHLGSRRPSSGNVRGQGQAADADASGAKLASILRARLVSGEGPDGARRKDLNASAPASGAHTPRDIIIADGHNAVSVDSAFLRSRQASGNGDLIESRRGTVSSLGSRDDSAAVAIAAGEGAGDTSISSTTSKTKNGEMPRPTRTLSLPLGADPATIAAKAAPAPAAVATATAGQQQSSKDSSRPRPRSAKERSAAVEASQGDEGSGFKNLKKKILPGGSSKSRSRPTSPAVTKVSSSTASNTAKQEEEQQQLATSGVPLEKNFSPLTRATTAPASPEQRRQDRRAAAAKKRLQELEDEKMDFGWTPTLKGALFEKRMAPNHRHHS